MRCRSRTVSGLDRVRPVYARAQAKGVWLYYMGKSDYTYIGKAAQERHCHVKVKNLALNMITTMDASASCYLYLHLRCSGVYKYTYLGFTIHADL